MQCREGGKPPLRVHLQQTPDEAPRRRGHRVEARRQHRAGADGLDNVNEEGALEGQLPREHPHQHHPRRPQVDGGAVTETLARQRVAAEKVRRQELGGAQYFPQQAARIASASAAAEERRGKAKVPNTRRPWPVSRC